MRFDSGLGDMPISMMHYYAPQSTFLSSPGFSFILARDEAIGTERKNAKYSRILKLFARRRKKFKKRGE